MHGALTDNPPGLSLSFLLFFAATFDFRRSMLEQRGYSEAMRSRAISERLKCPTATKIIGGILEEIPQGYLRPDVAASGRVLQPPSCEKPSPLRNRLGARKMTEATSRKNRRKRMIRLNYGLVGTVWFWGEVFFVNSSTLAESSSILFDRISLISTIFFSSLLNFRAI